MNFQVFKGMESFMPNFKVNLGYDGMNLEERAE